MEVAECEENIISLDLKSQLTQKDGFHILQYKVA